MIIFLDLKSIPLTDTMVREIHLRFKARLAGRKQSKKRKFERQAKNNNKRICQLLQQQTQIQEELRERGYIDQ